MIVDKYPIVFNAVSCDLGGFVETISPSAADRSLRDTADIVCLLGHDPNKPLGRRSAGTLRLSKQPAGVLASADISAAVTYAADLLQVLTRGDAPGCSFGFRALIDSWEYLDGVPHRVVSDMVIKEVSYGVTFPAYSQTVMPVRTLAPQKNLSVAWLQRVHRTRLAR